MAQATQRLLDYVRFRTEPEKRVAELEQMMEKPDPGPDFKQHLWDYVLLVSQGEQAGDLSDWIKTFYTDREGLQQLVADAGSARIGATATLARGGERAGRAQIKTRTPGIRAPANRIDPIDIDCPFQDPL